MRELEAQREQFSSAGFLHVTVPLDAPDPDVSGKVRRLLPNVVTVQVEGAALDAPKEMADRRALAPIELFRAYSVAEHGKQPDEPVEHAFEELHGASEEHP